MNEITTAGWAVRKVGYRGRHFLTGYGLPERFDWAAFGEVQTKLHYVVEAHRLVESHTPRHAAAERAS